MSEPGPSRPKRAKIQYRNPKKLSEEELLQALLASDDSEDELGYDSDDWYDASKASKADVSEDSDSEPELDDQQDGMS